MAKQTINIGASPNDGTGTPLRTAFDYTNQNFTELYTATGPSGNNIVVPGNATISGDLTASSDVLVNGNEKYVYLSSNYSIGNNSRVRFRAVGAGGGSGYGGDFRISTRASNNTWNTDVLTIDSSANCIWTDGAGGTRMTLNANGLGIGVTPSAWGTGLKVLQVGARGYGSFFDFNNDVVALTSNLFWTGSTYSRISASSKYAVAYYQDIGSGAHQWLSSSAAGTNSVTPTMNLNMTLDASGNLLVGKTGSNGTIGNGIINQADGAIWSTMAASTSASNTLLVYSTGAAAYRFYVSLDGTVNATNATISAISDARFKENVQDIDVGLGAILALKPRKFDWKAGKGKNIKGDRGFIAQEFETVFPNLIDEWKDEAPEGEAPYKSVRQDLIPVLVKAIQELTARVQTLETR